jgi:hypothetical protein
MFTGTSSASPFVAGIVGLMKALAPTLSYDQVKLILQESANKSSDPKVWRGYVDAFRAVSRVKSSAPVSVIITQPANGDTLSWLQTIALIATVNDPNPGAIFNNNALVWTSDRDGQLCVGNSCNASKLSPGPHLITARYTDPFGAVASASVSITVANNAPFAYITYPPVGTTYFASQSVNLRGYSYDPDGEILPGPKHMWTSDIDGALGTGQDIWKQLSQGNHTITLQVEDSGGLKGSTKLSLLIKPGVGIPTAKIITPTFSDWFLAGQTVVLNGTGTDPEDGNLTGTSLRWSSDIDGFLGTGNTVTTTLSAGSFGPLFHDITLEVSDSSGNKATHSVRVPCGLIF